MSAMWKRVISMMLVCTMLLPMTPLTVLAESLEEHEHDHEHADDLVGAQEPAATELVTEPTETPTEPASVPDEPTEAPAEPTEAPAEPTEAPAAQ